MTGVPSRVGVMGGGRMGVGIAHAFLLAGSSVTLLERNAEAAAQASEALLAAIEISASKPATKPAPTAGPCMALTTGLSQLMML